jgi:flagellar capping protein FliD
VPLSPANEVPPITNADASGSGTAIIALTVTKDSGGNITSATANFQISVAGFPAGTLVTDAHIHNGAAGGNAGIYVNTTLASGELTLTNGSGSVAKNGINVPSDRAAAILSNPAAHYFNVHTTLNPAGAIRGQLAGGGALVDPGTAVPY